jgi:Protein of unknown function (DUF1566)
MRSLQAARACLIVDGIVVLTGQAFAADSAASFRFTLALIGVGVKDNSTGLIGEQEPDREHDVWGASVARCATKEVGGQQAWRAPSVDELKTLIDASQHDPALPAGYPLSNIKSEIYWTATPHPTDDMGA